MLKKYYLHIIFALALVAVISACSTQKNTGMSRFYHNTTTKFNIFFNGAESYKEGMTSITKTNKDDYSRVLPMYPSSNHESLSSAASAMNRTIEKSRKAIKLHSIKKKPEKNFKKWNDPKYRAWYNQNEFNPALKEAWLMLAKSEFHKGDFLGSVGTFSYIMRHYATVPDVVAEAQIWTARAYAEMNWLYEAEEALTKLSTEKLNKKNTGLFSAAMADVLLKKKQYREAIPYLKLAVEREKDANLTTRFNYILAQLFFLTDDKKQAENYYSQVIKSSPPYEMEFNARINRAQLAAGSNVKSIEKELKGMAKSRKNKEYADQIYTALGNIFLNVKDTAKAISYYSLAKEKSQRNGVEKGLALVKLGDLYYEQKKYIKAEPNYNEASKIFTAEYDDYPRISKRAEVLAELVKEDEVVVLQDSLLRLANLSEKDRLIVINKIIENVKKEEKLQKEKQQQENDPNYRRNGNNPDDENFSMPMPGQMIGANPSGNAWYFYNANTVRNGKNDFRKKWGNRKLEDNWQRGSKTAALFADNNAAGTNNTSSAKNPQEETGESQNADETKQPAVSTDNKSVDFYLQQIPFTAKQKEKSNEEIADALFNMGFIFKDKMEDYPKAVETFEDFEKRYSKDERVLETMYQRFLIAAKIGDKASEERYRAQILGRYPRSNYADMLREPNFVKRMEKMYQEQDSIYNQTYAAYTRSEFPTVFKNVEYVKAKYPVSALMPKFEFLNALSIGKTQKSDLFKTSLDSLVAHYPNSDVSAMSKDILALMKQGNIAQLGKTHGSLLARRAEDVAATDEQNKIALSDSKEGKHRLMFVGNLTDSTLNKLLYNMAMFNFSRFMIKDFDFETGKINDTDKALSVTNLESFDETLWYEKTLRTDKELSRLIDSLNVKLIPISEDNFGKLKTFFTLDQYLDFEKENLLKEKPKKELAEAKITAKPETAKTTKQPEQKQPDTAKAKETTITKETKTVAETKINAPTEKKEKETTAEKTVSEKPAEKAASEKNIVEKAPEAASKPAEPEKPKVEEPQAWFKNTYAYRPNVPHFVALYIPTGGVKNFEQVQQAFDKYNTANYGMLNLKTSLENFGKQQAIIIGSFVDGNTAKSYFLRMLKDPALVEAMKGLNKRNLIGTQENLNTMVQKNDLNTYFEFMREFYLK